MSKLNYIKEVAATYGAKQIPYPDTFGYSSQYWGEYSEVCWKGDVVTYKDYHNNVAFKVPELRLLSVKNVFVVVMENIYRD